MASLHSCAFFVLLVRQLLKLSGEGLLTLMPTVTFLLAIETLAIVVFTDLSGLSEGNQKPVIVPGLQDVPIVEERGKMAVASGTSSTGSASS